MRKQSIIHIINNRLIVLFCCFIFLLSGCGKEAVEVRTISEKPEEEKLEDKTWSISTDGESFMVIPNMFMQDYADVAISDECTVAEKGELITCLAMIDSYWNKGTVTPEKFIEKFGKYINKNGTCDIDSISKDIMKGEGRLYEKMEFQPKTMSELISKYEATVLLEIPHNSLYHHH